MTSMATKTRKPAAYTEANRPVGLAEIASMLDLKLTAVRGLHHRGVMPPAEAIVSGNPTWQTATIRAWWDQRVKVKGASVASVDRHGSDATPALAPGLLRFTG